VPVKVWKWISPTFARPHLIRGLLGEGQCENAPAIDALPHQVNEAAGKGRGFARTGTGENEMITAICRTGAVRQLTDLG
jgi:hypothetical protein